jgi:hypothetical protein
VRIASWAFVLCTLLGVVAVFAPCIQLSIGDKRGVSIYKVQADRVLAQRFIVGYGKHKKTSSAFVVALLPRTKGKAHDVLDDASDAMSTLDDVSEDDAKTAGKVLQTVVWSFLLLSVVGGGLVLRQVVQGDYRRGPTIAAAGITLLTSAIAIAIRVGCGEVVFEANDEIGKAAFELGWGAWAMPAATLAALATGLALVVLTVRACRRTRRSPA